MLAANVASVANRRVASSTHLHGFHVNRDFVPSRFTARLPFQICVGRRIMVATWSQEGTGMKRIALLVALVLGFAVDHATAQEVTYNFDRDTDFSKFLSYKWVDIKSVQQVDYLTTQQITAVIDSELAKKGLFKTNSDYADLYIGYQTALSRQTLWMAYRDGWGYGPGWGGGLAAIAESSIHAGELDLDIYKAAEKKLVWRGAVPNAFDLTLNLGDNET